MTARADGKLRADAITDVERPWVELVEKKGVRVVRDLLLGRGVSVSRADSISHWLADQAERRRNISHETAWRYRKELQSVGAPERPKVRSLIPGYRVSGSLAA